MPVLATSLVSLKVEEPYLPPRNWESLPSQSGRFLPPTRSSASSSSSSSFVSVSFELAFCFCVNVSVSVWLRSDTLIGDLGNFNCSELFY